MAKLQGKMYTSLFVGEMALQNNTELLTDYYVVCLFMSVCVWYVIMWAINFVHMSLCTLLLQKWESQVIYNVYSSSLFGSVWLYGSRLPGPEAHWTHINAIVYP
jgi:hypothetical protein